MTETEQILSPTPHPILQWPFTEDEVMRAADNPALAREIVEFYNDRERKIRLAEEDPYDYGFEPEIWKRVDQLLEQDEIVAVFGANRTSKSHYAAKRIVQASVTNPRSVFLCLGEAERQAIATMHKMVWEYLPSGLKALNGKRNPVYKINWTQANGFTDSKIVLPNHTEIYFCTYNMDPGDYEGWEFGSRDKPVLAVWADESLPAIWLKLFERRLKFRNARMVWTFTPVRGMTPAIKEFLGASPLEEESAPADLLPHQSLPGLPKGHMPTVRRPGKGRRAIYFHLGANPFGNYTAQIRELCEGKTIEFIERIAYGFARDIKGRAFPKFGAHNVISPDKLPVHGTNYCLVDPAGNRNWAVIWVRVTADDPPKLYVYRDWPDTERYGEWAVPTERQVDERSVKGWDGDAGPAQITLGYGVLHYKQLFLDLESVHATELDPYRKLRWEKRGKDETPREEIFQRYIDPRAASTESTAEEGTTCIAQTMAEEQLDRSGKVAGPSMVFTPAPGISIDEGLNLINDLLEWNEAEPMDPIMNSPRLFVSDRAQQVVWAMSNYTGLAGAKGACKDFVDLLRYMATASLEYFDVDKWQTRGGGGY